MKKITIRISDELYEKIKINTKNGLSQNKNIENLIKAGMQKKSNEFKELIDFFNNNFFKKVHKEFNDYRYFLVKNFKNYNTDGNNNFTNNNNDKNEKIENKLKGEAFAAEFFTKLNTKK